MYVQKIHNTYRYRYRIPQDLNQYFPINELTKTLKTDNATIAEHEASKLHLEVLELMRKVRVSKEMSLLSDEEIYNKTKSYLKKRLNSDYQARIRKSSLNGFCRDELPQLKDGDITKIILDKYKEDISLLRLSEMKEQAGALVNIEIDESEESHKKLMFELLRTNIILFQEIQNRNEGKYSSETIYNSPTAPSEPSTAPSVPSMTMQEALNEYIKYQEKIFRNTQKGKAKISKAQSEGKKLRYETTDNMSNTLGFLNRDWMYIIGKETDINCNIEDLSDGIEELLSMPIRIGKTQLMPPKELWALEDVDTISRATANKHLGKIKSFYDWCFSRRYTKANFAEEVEAFIDTEGAIGKRMAFEPEEIRKLFSHLNDDMLVVAKVLAYSGMRPSELWRCQLTDDSFDLTADGIKTKNRSSKRKVPKSYKLNEIPLARIEEVRTRYSQGNASNIINKVINTCMETNKSKSLYSLRHSFATMLYRKNVPEPKINELMGHSKGRTMSTTVYNSGSTPDELSEIVNKLDYDE